MQIYLIDFTCVHKESHSLDSLNRFRLQIQAHSDWKIKIVIPNTEPSEFLAAGKHKKLPYRKQILGKKRNLSWIGFFIEISGSFFRLKNLLVKNERQGLIFPNADPGSIVSIFLLARLYPDCSFFIRLIGWTEFWTPGHPFLIKFIVNRTHRLKNVFFAAETQSLQKFFNLDHVAPYPIEVQNRNKMESVYLFLAGSARKEKGFEKLPTLAKQLKNAELPYILVAQQTHAHNENLLRIQNELTKFENVMLLPPYLSRSQLINWIDNSKVVLMPYESSAYKLRGSAVLFEASERSTPVIAFSGGGYESNIIDFNLGEIADNEFDVIPALLRLQSNSLKQDLYADYALYTQNCLRSWLQI